MAKVRKVAMPVIWYSGEGSGAVSILYSEEVYLFYIFGRILFCVPASIGRKLFDWGYAVRRLKNCTFDKAIESMIIEESMIIDWRKSVLAEDEQS